MVRARRRRHGRRPRGAGPRVPLRTAFATRALRQCLLAAATSRMVDTAVLVVVSVVLFDRGGAAAVAAYGVVTTLGPALGTPLVTAVAGRLRPGHALAGCLGGAAVGLALTTAAVATGAPVAAVLAAVGGSIMLVASIRPLVTSLLPSCIRSPEELAATNTAAAGVETVSMVLGPLLAGAGLALADPTTLLVAAAVVLLLAAAATASLPAAPRPVGDPGHVVAEVLAGLRAILGRGPARLVTLLVGSQAFGRGALNVIVVSLAIDRLGLGDSGVGLLLGAVGLGGLFGLPVAVRVAGVRRHGRNLVVALAVWGIPLVAVGLTTVDPVVLVLLGVAGLGNTVLDISSDSLLQRLAPRGGLATLLGAFEATVFLTKAAGATTAGLLLAVSGPGTAIIAVGALPVALAALGAVPALRLDGSIRDRDTGVALLRSSGIFSPLVLSAVDQLSGAATLQEHAPGEQILVEGEVGDRYYVIESGEVDVVRDGRVIDRMRRGDGFGEVALLDGSPRNATIVARTPTTTRSLGRASFVAALHADDRSRTAAEQVADGRRPHEAHEPDDPDEPGDTDDPTTDGSGGS